MEPGRKRNLHKGHIAEPAPIPGFIISRDRQNVGDKTRDRYVEIMPSIEDEGSSLNFDKNHLSLLHLYSGKVYKQVNCTTAFITCTLFREKMIIGCFQVIFTIVRI